jgi:molecular chaperone GrpE
MRLEQEEILHRFQEWLTQTNRELEQLADEPSAPAVMAPSQPAGLLTLVEAFTALRHELKLQTKSARGVEESLQTALAGLDRAMERFSSVEPQETVAAEKAMRPLVEALIELDEALRRGARAVAASQQRLSEELPRRLAEDLEQRFAQRSAWQRWRSRPWQAEVLQCCRQLVAETQGPLLASLGDGYQLICGRLQRLLTEHRIERLACVGQSVDPAQMRVVELVDAPGVPPETVVEEIRPGYAWRGRVVRYAEVRATRAAPQHPDGEDEEPAGDMEPVEDADWDDPFDRNEAVAEEELWQGKDARYGNDRRD